MKRLFPYLLALFLASWLAPPVLLHGQQRQRISPLPKWEQKNDKGDYVVGSYMKKVSARTELVSFYAHLPNDLDSKGSWFLSHYGPIKAQPLIVMTEKQPVDYLRLESAKQTSNGGIWKTYGPWSFAPNSIPAANMAVLIQYEPKGQAAYFVPAILYQKQKPAAIQSYRAVFLAGSALKSGSYTVSQGNTVLHSGKIGQQLGGATFNINIPLSKLPAKGAALRVQLSLIEQGKTNGPQLVFDFYHQPYP